MRKNRYQYPATRLRPSNPIKKANGMSHSHAPHTSQTNNSNKPPPQQQPNRTLKTKEKKKKEQFWDSESSGSDSDTDETILALRELSSDHRRTLDSHPRTRWRSHDVPKGDANGKTAPPTRSSQTSTTSSNRQHQTKQDSPDDLDTHVDEMTRLIPYDGTKKGPSTNTRPKRPPHRSLQPHKPSVMKKRSLQRDRTIDQQTGGKVMQSHEVLQQEHEEEQDGIIEDMSTTVSRLTLMGRTMHEELKDHTELLTDLKEDVDDNQNHLGKVSDKLEVIIGETGRGHYCIIFGLLTVLMIMLWMIFG